jgi:hypothetical protein
MTWNWASLYWLLWILIGFLPMELYALASGHSEWTLSWQFWNLEGSGATFWRWVVASLFLWLFVHMVWRKFT